MGLQDRFALCGKGIERAADMPSGRAAADANDARNLAAARVKSKVF
jgi:hypothetical protein